MGSKTYLGNTRTRVRRCRRLIPPGRVGVATCSNHDSTSRLQFFSSGDRPGLPLLRNIRREGFLCWITRPS